MWSLPATRDADLSYKEMMVFLVGDANLPYKEMLIFLTGGRLNLPAPQEMPNILIDEEMWSFPTTRDADLPYKEMMVFPVGDANLPYEEMLVSLTGGRLNLPTPESLTGVVIRTTSCRFAREIKADQKPEGRKMMMPVMTRSWGRWRWMESALVSWWSWVELAWWTTGVSR